MQGAFGPPASRMEAEESYLLFSPRLRVSAVNCTSLRLDRALPSEMKPSPAMVFDLGKVLVDFDYSLAARRVAARSRRPVDPVHFFSEQAPVLLRYELGQLTTREFFEQIRQSTEFEGTLEEFGGFFADIFTEMPEMIELHSALRRAGFQTFIFSNTNELAVSHIRRRFPFFSRFDAYVYSYEHGSMKPDAKLYEAVESATGRRGADLVYIDDRPENIGAGAARGWRTVLQETPGKTRSVLAALGIQFD
jgi:putative hydrolase of the HAD superfamily